MKTLNLSIACAAVAFAVGFTSCKKTEALTAAQENATTVELAQDQSTSDNMTEDANNIFFEAALNKGATGNRPVAGRPMTPINGLGLLIADSVSITTTTGHFPYTITINFGAGTTYGGASRSGIVTIVLDSFVRVSGSTAVMTFNNYHVNGYKVEGTITWTNTSTPSQPSWHRELVNGKITNDINGHYWTHFGTRDITQTAGYDTPFDLRNDIFSMTGSHTVTNSSGASRTATILTALVKATICPHIQSGSVRFDGPNHYLVIDYGNGTCDDQATYAIDGGTATTFTL